MTSIGENLTDAEVDELMKEVDRDGNGSIDCEFSFFFCWGRKGNWVEKDANMWGVATVEEFLQVLNKK